MFTCVTRGLRFPKPAGRFITSVALSFRPLDVKMDSSLEHQLRQNRVFVRTVPTEDHVLLTMLFGGPSSTVAMKARKFNFRRMKSETLGRTLERMAQNLDTRISATAQRKKRKKADSPKEADHQPDLGSIEVPAPVEVKLRNLTVDVPLETTNGEAWREGATLHLSDLQYKVIVNSPSIVSGKLTTHILPEFPVDFSLDFEFAEEGDAIFVWLMRGVGKTVKAEPTENLRREAEELGLSFDTVSAVVQRQEVLTKPFGSWQIISFQREWRPVEKDVGNFVALVCFPVREGIIGEPFAVVSKNSISTPVPQPIPFVRRQETCNQRSAPGRFRVISYNLLADTYADQLASMKDLFPYCPPEFIKFDYRRQLMLRELVGYNADLICLQEMDTKFFDKFFLRRLRYRGFDGCHRPKQGAKSVEGVATFFRTDKFRLLSRHDIGISEALFNDPLHASLAEMISNKPKLKQIVEERRSAFQVTALQSLDLDTPHVLIVCNTHLWFKPQFPHVRLIQMAVAMKHLETVVNALREQSPSSIPPAILFCGDLNSSSGWGVTRFLKTGLISEDSAEWKQFCKEDDEYIQTTLHHPFDLYSACGELPYTNFVVNFKAAIDWIFADKNSFETVSVIPVPTVEELSQFIAIPSKVFPSDHLAVGCDLKWKQ